MIPPHVYYQLVILVLIWLCVMLPHLWASLPRVRPSRPAAPIKPKCKHLTLRVRIKRLVRQTICFSKSTQMHDIAMGWL